MFYFMVSWIYVYVVWIVSNTSRTMKKKRWNYNVKSNIDILFYTEIFKFLYALTTIAIKIIIILYSVIDLASRFFAVSRLSYVLHALIPLV